MHRCMRDLFDLFPGPIFHGKKGLQAYLLLFSPPIAPIVTDTRNNDVITLPDV